jgi:hypothetical protein
MVANYMLRHIGEMTKHVRCARGDSNHATAECEFDERVYLPGASTL